jgi:hypothetical protein
MIHIAIILAVLSFGAFYYFIKKEIMCKCDEDHCDCYTKKNNMAIKYGLLAGLVVFASCLIIIYYNNIREFFTMKQPVSVSTGEYLVNLGKQ